PPAGFSQAEIQPATAPIESSPRFSSRHRFGGGHHRIRCAAHRDGAVVIHDV
ncbi:uncharacterized protein METZ01_LOCUS359575, partial [marine metagenome]